MFGMFYLTSGVSKM